MTGEESVADDQSIDRRTVLAIISGAIVTAFSALFAIITWDDTDQDEPGPTDTDPEPQPAISDAVNVREYGAEPNPEDPDLETAVELTEAIRQAAIAAGSGGAIYLPSGTYRIGRDAQSYILEFGERGLPAGISIYGDGPEETTLGLTEHMDPDDQSHVMLQYSDEGDHNTVAASQITFDGNSPNLDGLASGQTRAARCFSVEGQNELELTNVRFVDWYNTTLRLNEWEASIDHCTFQNIGIEGRQNGQTGHAIEIETVGTVEVTNSLLERIAGFALNVRYNDGTVIVRNCFVRGAGGGMVKLSAGERLEIHNSYVEPYTQWMDDNTPSYDDPEKELKGRHIVQKLFERGEKVPTVVMNNVEGRNFTAMAMKVRNAPINWEGDMISIHNSCQDYGSAAILEDEGGKIQNTNVGRISIHNTNGQAFQTPGSNGTISTLREGGNVGLGNTGGIQLNNLLTGNPLQPDVTSREAVGTTGTFSDRFR